MDQETRDYLDRKLLMLARREEIEKLRQEPKSISDNGKKKTQPDPGGDSRDQDRPEQWRKEEKLAIDSLRTEVMEKIEALKEKKPFPLDQWTQDMSSLSSTGQGRDPIESWTN